MKGKIEESELIINSDGSVYHLHVLPHQIAETIFTVGDPDRVEMVSNHFDSIQYKVQHREFITHTGFLNNKRVSVISTGISTDNIDIVLNELDALVNIDFETRQIKQMLTSLDIIRLGTSGAVIEETEVDSVLIAEIALGMDGLLNFYRHEISGRQKIYLEAFSHYLRGHFITAEPYISGASAKLLNKLGTRYSKGTTLTTSGFYAPQGRTLRLEPMFPDFIQVINRFSHQDFRITNFDMETAAIYGLGTLLGHHCISVNAILANRVNHTFSSDPVKCVDKMIREVLEIITS